MGTVIPFNHFLLVPVWQEKKGIEEEHPEWKKIRIINKTGNMLKIH